jgi:hypothetical protein
MDDIGDGKSSLEFALVLATSGLSADKGPLWPALAANMEGVVGMAAETNADGTALSSMLPLLLSSWSAVSTTRFLKKALPRADGVVGEILCCGLRTF